CILQFDVTDASNQVAHWMAETENPSSMIRQGWTRQSINPGDQITLTVMPVKNGNLVGRIIEILLPNGQKLSGRGAPENSKPEDAPKQCGISQARHTSLTVSSQGSLDSDMESLACNWNMERVRHMTIRFSTPRIVLALLLFSPLLRCQSAQPKSGTPKQQEAAPADLPPL